VPLFIIIPSRSIHLLNHLVGT